MNPQVRGRGRGMFGRAYDFYPQFAPFGSFPPTLGYPLPGYQAAAAAATAAYSASQHAKGPRSAERTRPGFTYTYPSTLSSYYPFVSPTGDRRPQYYAEYANLSSPGLPRGNNPGRADGQAAVEYSDYAVGVQVNGFSPQTFAAPPSPLSRFSQPQSPGPMAPHDMGNYIASTAENALTYSATSPQTTSFAHPMAITLRQ